MSYSPKWDAAAVTRKYFATGLHINQAATDIASFTGLPAKYIVNSFKLYDASATPIAGTLGLRNAAAGGGSAIVADTTVPSLTAATVVLAMTLAITDYQTVSTLYLRNGTANVANVTLSAVLEITELS